MDVSGSSLLPTPLTVPDSEASHNQLSGTFRAAMDRALSLLPTPSVADADGGHVTRGGSRSGEILLGGIAQLLPTPTSRDHKGPNQRGDASCLTGALLPTPRATDGTKGGPNQRSSSGDLMLPSAVQLLPTPTATPYGNNQSPSPGAAVRPSLDSLAAKLLPTPTTMDANSSEGSTPSNVTLTDATVRSRLGARMNPRFDAGNGSPAELPLPLSPEPAEDSDCRPGSSNG
jgi:hypothetical protein